MDHTVFRLLLFHLEWVTVSAPVWARASKLRRRHEAQDMGQG